MTRPSYNPKGVSKNPIPVRLMQGEQAEVDGIAETVKVSRSKVLRDCIVAGLPIVKAALLSSSAAASTSPTPTLGAAAFTGGEAPASPAGLSLKTA